MGPRPDRRTGPDGVVPVPLEKTCQGYEERGSRTRTGTPSSLYPTVDPGITSQEGSRFLIQSDCRSKHTPPRCPGSRSKPPPTPAGHEVPDRVLRPVKLRPPGGRSDRRAEGRLRGCRGRADPVQGWRLRGHARRPTAVLEEGAEALSRLPGDPREGGRLNARASLRGARHARKSERPRPSNNFLVVVRPSACGRGGSRGPPPARQTIAM